MKHLGGTKLFFRRTFSTNSSEFDINFQHEQMEDAPTYITSAHTFKAIIVTTAVQIRQRIELNNKLLRPKTAATLKRKLESNPPELRLQAKQLNAIDFRVIINTERNLSQPGRTFALECN